MLNMTRAKTTATTNREAAKISPPLSVFTEDRRRHDIVEVPVRHLKMATVGVHRYRSAPVGTNFGEGRLDEVGARMHDADRFDSGIDEMENIGDWAFCVLVVQYRSTV